MNAVSRVMSLAVMPALAFDGREPADPRTALLMAVNLEVDGPDRPQDTELLKVRAEARPEVVPNPVAVRDTEVNPQEVNKPGPDRRHYFLPPLITTALRAPLLPALASSHSTSPRLSSRALCLASLAALRSASSSLATRRRTYPRAAGP